MLPAGLVLFLLLALLQTPETIPSGSYVDPCLGTIDRTESAEPGRFAAGSAMTSAPMVLASSMPLDEHWASEFAWLPGGSPPLPRGPAEVCRAEPAAADDSALAHLMILVAVLGLGVNVNRKRRGGGSEHAEADCGPTDCGLPLGC